MREKPEEEGKSADVGSYYRVLEHYCLIMILLVLNRLLIVCHYHTNLLPGSSIPWLYKR